MHGLILLYEKQFQIAALKITEGGPGGDGNSPSSSLSTNLTPCGWINVSIDPPEFETSFETSSSTVTSKAKAGASTSSPSLLNGAVHHPEPQLHPPTASYDSSSGSSAGSDDRFLESLPKKVPGSQSFGPPGGSQSSLAGTSTSASRNVWNQVWKGMVFLATDPYPEVASIAQEVIHSVHDKVIGAGLKLLAEPFDHSLPLSLTPAETKVSCQGHRCHPGKFLLHLSPKLSPERPQHVQGSHPWCSRPQKH